MRVSSRGLVAACLLSACSARPLEAPLGDVSSASSPSSPASPGTRSPLPDAGAAATDASTPRAADLGSPPPEPTSVNGAAHAARSAAIAVDMLFVIDDSGSMAPKQWSLRQRFPALLAQLAARGGLGYDLHIGVTNTDLGAPGTSCGWVPGGRLLRLGAWSDPGCRALEREPYLTINTATGETNAPIGQDVATTFTCMAAVGESGCGFEMPLESAYRTLSVPDGSGFLRDDAMLVVVFVTDEDDCSVDDPSSDLFVSPAYGPQSSFRCSRFGVVCDGTLLPSMPAGPFGACRPATAADGGRLAAIEKYRNYFTASRAEGGLKADPSRVVLASLAGPPTPVAVTTGHGEAACGVGVEHCPVLAHSCGDATRFADPAVRLAALVGATPRHVQRSICDDDFSGFFGELAAEITR